MKNIYLIIGPSGSGKTTLTEALAKEHGLKTVWSYTTRPPRYEGEEGHIFVSDEEFDKLGEMCAYTEYNGYRYGVTSEIINQSDIYVIDPPGVEYMYDHYYGKKGMVPIFLDIDECVRARRMLDRGDNAKDVQKRILLDEKWFDPKTFEFPLGLTISDHDEEQTYNLTPEEVQQMAWKYICAVEEL